MINVYLCKRKTSSNYYMRWTDPESGRDIWQSTKTRIKRDAERLQRSTERELNEGTFCKLSPISWVEFRDRYETEQAVSLAARTQNKINTVMNYVERHLNPKKLRELNETKISKLVKKLREQGLEEITIKYSLGHLRSMLNWAKTQKLIAQVPEFPKLKRARGKKVMRGRPITLEEFERIIKAIPAVMKPLGQTPASMERHRQVVQSWEFYLWGLWYSGLRLTESLQLHWEREDGLFVDLDGEFPIMRIRAEAEKGNKDRLLPITPDFAEFLQAVPEDQRTGPVFKPLPNRCHDTELIRESISRLVAKMGEKAGVIVGDKGNIDKVTGERKPRYASAHDFRRAFGVRWSRKMQVFELKELMRHQSIKTTEEFYLEQHTQDTARSIWAACKVDQRDNSRNSSGSADHAKQ
ncbi:site-specific tyrosine recombinase XerC [Gimesia chilikensis]|uniref:Site-specific tyrosine recombinase XerC n=2 Tax=Gimesia chilikensis TaxID=2605989 RepID=A0A517PIL3_9PLAN|nr:site-specific tyrosine recombinase XerC [Gimesia chilikensis]